MKRLKVLVSAYACEPNKGSEPGVGWNWVKQIARFHDVWVMTRENNRDIINAELKLQPIDNLHFIYFDLPRWARFFKKGRKGYQLYYYLWQVAGYFKAREYCKLVNFDVSHHITFSPCFYPSFLSLLPVPFIWGPVGGVEKYPKSFWKFFGASEVIKELVREVYTRGVFYLDPFLWLTLRRAAVIFVCDQDTKKFLEKKVKKQATPIYVTSQVGIDIDKSSKKDLENNEIVFLTSGRLVSKKGVYILVRAFLQVAANYPNVRFLITGDGIAKKRIMNLVKRDAMADKVNFLGFVDDKTLTELYKSSDVFLMGSLQDSGGLVVLEAMTTGLPVIAFDLGGPGEIITEECGIKIPACNIEQAIEDFSKAIEELALDPEKRRRLGIGAVQRVSEVYDWEKKGAEIALALSAVRYPQ